LKGDEDGDAKVEVALLDGLEERIEEDHLVHSFILLPHPARDHQ